MILKEKHEFRHKYRMENTSVKIMRIFGCIYVIVSLITLFSQIKDRHLGGIILAIFSILVLLIFQGILALATKNYNVPEVSIDNTEIILIEGVFRNEKQILLDDIIKIEFKKYDEEIEFITKDKKRHRIRLIKFYIEDKEKLIGIFNNMKQH